MTIGAALRHLRHASKISQKDLARRAGISPSYLSLIEADRREASVPLIRRFAEELGAPAVLLFATVLAGSAENPATSEVAAVLDRLIHAVGYEQLQSSLALELTE